MTKERVGREGPTEPREGRAEQQGDGQPENVRELEDDSGGAALAGGGREDEQSRDGDHAGDDASGARGLRGGRAPSRESDDGPLRTRGAGS